MAGQDVVGALYYKVVLDPRGYAKGVTQVKSEQAVLARAINSSVSEFDRLQAELDAIGAMYLKSKEEHRKVLQAAQAEIIKQMEELVDAEEKAARLAEDKKVKEQAEEEINALQLVMNKHKQKTKLIEGLAKLQEQANKEANEEILRAEKDRIAEEKRLEKELADFRKQRLGRRYENMSRYFTSMGRFKVLLRRMRLDIGNVNGGLSKMAGNLAMAAGMSPAMQGLARSLGSVGVKFLLIGTAIAGLVKFMKSAIMQADEFRKQQIRLMPLLDNNASKTKMFMNEIMTLAARTGFASTSMFELAESLMQLGVSAQNVPQVSKLLAGLSGGSEQRMKSIAKAYSDVMMKGRLMGQEALQFANAGIPIYKALADSMGVTAGKVRKMMEEGQISADQMARALTEYGQLRNISGQISENMKTVSGQLSRISTLFRQIMGEIGSGKDTMLADFLRVIGNILEKTNEIRAMWKKFTEDLSDIGALMPMYAGADLLKSLLGQFYETYLESAEEKAARLREEQRKTNEELLKNVRAEKEAKKQREAAFQAAADFLKQESKMTEAQKERRDMEMEFLEWLSQQGVDEEQAKQLAHMQAMINAQREYVDARKEAIELERESAEAAAKEAAAKEKAIAGQAAAGAGAGFGAGGVGEFNFLKDMLMGRRKNNEELAVMMRQEKALMDIKDLEQQQLDALESGQDAFVGPVLPIGGP